MISKKMFVDAINNIKTQERKMSEFSKALSAVCDGHPIFDTNNLYLKSLLDVLGEVFHDEHNTISWWLWEDVEKKIWINYDQEDQVTIDVSTPESLYDYLIESMNDSDRVVNSTQNTDESEGK